MVVKSALLAGSHPMLDDVAGQYEERSFSVTRIMSGEGYSGRPDELFIATQCPQEEKVLEDMRNIGLIRSICTADTPCAKTRCHLLVHSREVMALLEKGDLFESMKAYVDLYPFTEAGVWAQRIFAPLPGESSHLIDREMMYPDSDKTVHIVIFGMNPMAETLAEYAALTCHYSNYSRNHSLRTRVSIIDDGMTDRMYDFRCRYQSLFDNSYYRTVNLKSSDGAEVVEFHAPEYDGIREDFVDVEWEFINGGIWSNVLKQKLIQWSEDPNRLLTVILSHDTDNQNLSTALKMPEALSLNGIPVMVRMSTTDIMALLSDRKNIMPFGMKRFSYDVRLPLVQMAKMVNYVYECCYEDNYRKGSSTGDVFSPVAIDMSKAEISWMDLPYSKRMSNVCNAMTIPVKMRLMGYESEDWSVFYGMSGKDIATIAEVEHNRWNVAELLLGSRPVTVEQEAEIEKDAGLKKKYRESGYHYDLRAYRDLRKDATGRNANTYDICLSGAVPLIANTFITECDDA